MAKIGYIEKEGKLHLIIVPEGGIEFGLITNLIEPKSSHEYIAGELSFAEQTFMPTIIIKSHSVSVEKKAELMNKVIFCL
jgi:hypothetical protein